MNACLERRGTKFVGSLSCFDRVIFKGHTAQALKAPNHTSLG